MDRYTLIEEAASSYRAGDFEEAAKLYKEILELDVVSPESLLNLAHCFEHLGQLEVAEGYAERAKFWSPTWPEVWCTLGRIRMQRGQYDEARAAFETCLKLGGAVYSNARMCLAALYREQGLDSLVEPLLREVLKEQPDDVWSLSTLGSILYDNENFEEAEGLFAKVLALEPGVSYASYAAYHLAGCFFARGCYSEAASMYRRTLASHPEDRDATVGLVQCLLELQGFEEVCEILSADESLVECDPTTLFYRAFALNELGRSSEAAQEYRNYIKLVGFDADAIYNLAAYELNEGSGKEAIRLLADATEQAPNDSRLFRFLGEVKLCERDVMGALDALNRSIALAADEWSAHYWRGSCFACLEKLDLAVVDLTEAGRLAPDHAEIWALLANCEKDRGNRKCVEESVERGLQLPRPSYPSILLLADALIYLGRKEEGLALCRESMGDSRTSPACWIHYADLQGLCGERETMLHAVRTAIELKQAFHSEYFRLFEDFVTAGCMSELVDVCRLVLALPQNDPALECVYQTISGEFANPDRARQIIANSLAKWPDDVMLNCALAICEALGGNEEKALGLLKTIEAKYP